MTTYIKHFFKDCPDAALSINSTAMAYIVLGVTVAGDVQHLKMPGKQDELYVVRWLAG